MATELELHSLVDLALRNPDVGVVNFNHLHQLLHAILNHIGIGRGVKVEFLAKLPATETAQPPILAPPEENGPTAAINKDATTAKETERLTHEEMAKDGASREGIERRQFPNRDEIRRLTSRQNHVEKKVLDLEEKLELVDQLPTNKDIISWAQQQQQQHGPAESPVAKKGTDKDNMLSEMWQFMKVNRRLQAVEEAVERTMSILNEFLGGGGESIKSLLDSVRKISEEMEIVKDKISGASNTSVVGTAGSAFNNNKLPSDSLEALDRRGQYEYFPHDKLGSFATKDDLQMYVKWSALEEALNVSKSDPKRTKVLPIEVRRTSFKGDVQRLPMEVLEEGEVITKDADERARSAPAPPPSQSPVCLPEAPKTALTRSTQADGVVFDWPQNAHPSPEMVECLRQIAELTKHHDVLAQATSELRAQQRETSEEMRRMEGGLRDEVYKQQLRIPEDLQDQLDELKRGLDSLSTNQDSVALAEVRKTTQGNKERIEGVKRELAVLARQNRPVYVEKSSPSGQTEHDGDVLRALSERLMELQGEQQRLATKVEQSQAAVVDELNRKQDHVDVLYSYVERLQDTKADKENVASEMNVKADKEALDSKVSVATFDNTFTLLDEGLKEALHKMDDYMNEELALKQALRQLSLDMSEKMDGQAFQALQQYLERRIADVQKSRNLIAKETNVDLTNAAGLRRPLPLRFHCISCNRPVDGPAGEKKPPLLPQSQGVRMKRSKAPYLSYEIDQIRHYQKALYTGMRPDKTASELVSGRPCGGVHTVTRQQLRKHNRAAQLGHVTVRDDPQEYPNWSRDLSVVDLLQGSDGQMYKGRYKQTIPPIPKTNSSPSSERDSDCKSVSDQTDVRSQYEQEKGEESPRSGGSSKLTTPPTSRKSSPRSRMKHIVKQHRPASPVAPVPSPSPPTVRENEYQQLLQKQQREELARQREGPPSKLFSPGLRQSPEVPGASAELPPAATTTPTVPSPQVEDGLEQKRSVSAGSDKVAGDGRNTCSVDSVDSDRELTPASGRD